MSTKPQTVTIMSWNRHQEFDVHINHQKWNEHKVIGAKTLDEALMIAKKSRSKDVFILDWVNAGKDERVLSRDGTKQASCGDFFTKWKRFNAACDRMDDLRNLKKAFTAFPDLFVSPERVREEIEVKEKADHWDRSTDRVNISSSLNLTLV